MVNDKLNVLVNGMGNIGTTLANLLLTYKKELQIDNIFVAKRTLTAWNKVERNLLEERGAIICSSSAGAGEIDLSTVLSKVHYIFEATANGVAISNKPRYESLPHLIGSSAQGSEKAYGIPFMTGVNEEAIRGTKFVTIVSCNTHGSAALLKTFCGDRLELLKQADVVVVRRSEDLGNHQRLVSANVVARHLDDTAGTHHSVDVIDLFKTIDCECNLTSSDITTPSQLMHSVRFNIEFKEEMTDKVQERIALAPLIARTAKFDSNVIFELGRRYGFNGRIFSHAIIIDGNLLVTPKQIKGWAFVPQEGNSLLSTLHAFLLQVQHPKTEDVFEQIKKDLLRKEW